MKKRFLSLLLVMSILFLWSCGAPAEEAAEPSPATQSTTAATDPLTEAPTEAPAQPETEPVTEPPLVLDPGPAVYVNGTAIAGTAIDGDVVYVSAEAFCAALGGQTMDGGVSTLEYGAVSYTFSPSYSHIMRGERATVLLSPVLNYQNAAYLPLKELCQMLEISVFQDTEQNTLYCTPSAWPREIPEGYDVPVFMYHAVDNDLWGISELFVKPERMEEQLKYLSENGYDTIFFEDLYNIDQYDKPVILTFDDGYLDNYTNLFPLLQKYNCKATIFVINQYIGNDVHYTNPDQLLEMANSGLVSIQSHTVTHPNLDTLDIEEQRHELEQSKLETCRMTRRESFVLCYPTGRYDNDTLEIIGDYYHFGIKMNGGLYTTGDSPFEINRYYISRDTSTSSFISILEGIFEE